MPIMHSRKPSAKMAPSAVFCRRGSAMSQKRKKGREVVMKSFGYSRSAISLSVITSDVRHLYSSVYGTTYR